MFIDRCLIGNMVLGNILVICVLLLKTVEGAPPVISNLPTIVYVGESETTERPLYYYDIADPDGNTFLCTNTITGSPGADSDNEFEIRWNLQTGKYELWLTAVGTFNYNVIDTFDNLITCTDSTGQSNTPLNLQIKIVDNEAVSVYNAVISKNAATTGVGATIDTVNSVSNNGHRISYSLTSDPSFSPEYFVIDSSTGIITTIKALNTIDAGTPVVYLIAAAFDTVDHILVYNNITVTLTNQNTVPTTGSLPANATVNENQAAGSILFTLTPVDPDSGDTHTYRFTCVPSSGDTVFTIDTSGRFKIATGQTLNHESASSYTCSFYINDGTHEVGPFTYTLYVTDVNEAPTFSRTTYYGFVTEGAQGSVTFTPGFTCSDPDDGDSTTFSLKSSTDASRFRILSSGEMTFNVDYDVDNGNMPTSVTLTVECVDSGTIDGTALTGTAQVEITIEDSNDNAPTFPSTSYSFVVTSANSAGDVIGTITPTDADSLRNGDFTCSGISTSAYSPYFSVGFNCNVYLTRTIDFASGTYISIIASAVDYGTPQLTGTTGIDIFYSDTTTTTTTTTTDYNFFDEGGNVAMFVITLLMALAFLGLITWCLLTRCGRIPCGQNPCRDRAPNRQRQKPWRIQRPITPEEPPPKKKVEKQEPTQIVRVYEDELPSQPTSPPRKQPLGYWRGPQIRPVAGRFPGYNGPPSLPGYYR